MSAVGKILLFISSFYSGPSPAPPQPDHVALPLRFAHSCIGYGVLFLWGSRGSARVALQMALETERFQMQAPNGVVEENSQNAWRIEAV